MKMNKILTFMVMLVLAVGAANAISYNFDVADSITTQAINDEITVVTFECTNADCSQTAYRNNDQSFSDGSVEYVFPTTSVGTKRFKLHVLTGGNIPHLLDLTVNQDLTSTISVNRAKGTLYMQTAALCYAPVVRLDEVNSLGEGAPLIIQYQTTIDSDIGSPFEYVERLTNSELQNSLVQNALTSNVNLELEIRRDGQLVDSFETTHEVMPEELAQFQYAYTPRDAGLYTVNLKSDVDSSYCRSVIDSTHTSTVTVEPSAPEADACYARVHNLQFTRPVIGADNTVQITGDIYARKSTGNNPATDFVDVPARVSISTPSSDTVFTVDLAAGENQLLETLTFPDTENAVELYQLNVVAAPSDATCTRTTTESKTLDVKRDDEAVSTTNGLIFKTIPDAIISITNPNYVVDLAARTVNLEDETVTYRAYASGFDYDKFDVEVNGQTLIVSLKQTEYYLQPYLTTVYVTATDGLNSVSRSFRVRTPSARGDTVAIAQFPNNIYKGTPALFDASDSITRPGVEIVEYKWDFGDNQPTQKGETVVHTYQETGFRIVKLTVTDSIGNIDIAQYPINVLPALNAVDVDPQDFFVGKYLFRNQEVKPGNSLSTVLSFTNEAEKDMDNIRVVLIIKELGIHKVVGPISVDSKETWTRQVALEVPEGSRPGEYYASLIISNEDFSRHKYNFVRLVEN